MRLSLEYFTNEKKVEIKKLLLTGGASLLKGESEYLEKNLEIPVLRWNPLTNLKVAADLSGSMQDNAYKLGVAFGLALYHYDNY